MPQSKKCKRETDVQSSSSSNKVSLVGGKVAEKQQPVGTSERGNAPEEKKAALAFVKRKLEKAKVDSGIITKMCDILAEAETVKGMLQSCSSKLLLRISGVSEEQINRLISRTSWLDEFNQLHSAEYLLQGKTGRLSGSQAEIDLANRCYNHDAVNVDCPRNSWPPERSNDIRHTNDIRLIYGPIGSGKTFYALKGLSQVRKEGSDREPLVLYANLSGMRNKLGATVDTAKNWLEGEMTRSIKELLKGNLIFDSKKLLNMTISVVLDEAMNADYLINDMSNLHELFSVIEKFSTSPRLIITGVGIEGCTKNLSSGVDVGKWRMRHWGRKNFDALVMANNCLNYHNENFGKMIKRHPFLEQLMTNARSAYFLADTLNFFVAKDIQRPPEFVAVVAQHVATKYIENSALSNISSDKQRMRKVVRAVLRLLWESSALRNDLIWPHDMLENQFASNERFVYEEFDDRDVVLIFCLLDINVEYQDGRLTRVDKKRYPIEISPALTIVLYQLLGVLGTKIASRWSDFEVLAALNELSLMVIFSESVEKPFQLRFFSKPVPASQSQINYDIPRVGGQCVFVNKENEERALYADVLAPGRFIQCKYTATPLDGCRLDISDELRKMGLLQNDTSIRKAYTLALCDQWYKKNEGEKIDKVVKGGDVSKVVSTRAFRQAYPVRVLLQREEECFFSNYVRCVQFQLKDKNILQAKNSEKSCYNADDKFQHNITAVFYTNAAFFMLVDGKEDGKHTIATTDVDREGALMSNHSFYEKQNELVDPKVILRFIFVCDEEVPPEDTEDS